MQYTKKFVVCKEEKTQNPPIFRQAGLCGVDKRDTLIVVCNDTKVNQIAKFSCFDFDLLRFLQFSFAHLVY
jgi:hypothetical protein